MEWLTPGIHLLDRGVYNAKAEECTTTRIGSRNIKIKIGGNLLPTSYRAVAIAAVCQPSSLQAQRSK